MLKAYSAILDGRVHSDHLGQIKDFSSYHSRLIKQKLSLYISTAVSHQLNQKKKKIMLHNK